MSVCILPFKVCLGSGLAAYLKAPALELKKAELDCKLRLNYQHLYLPFDNEDSALKRVGRIHNKRYASTLLSCLMILFFAEEQQTKNVTGYVIAIVELEIS